MKNKRVNISQLAKFCQVSPSAVSNVFNGTGKISEKTKVRIFEAATKLNYIPQQTARKDAIAIIIPSKQAIVPPFWFGSLICGAIQHALYQVGYIPAIYNANDLRLIRPSLNAAAIALSWTPQEDQYAELLGLRRPVICINAILKNTHHVCVDHAQGVRMAAEYLIARGHRRIGLLHLSNYKVWGESERTRGFREALQAHHIEFEPEWDAYRGNAEGQLDIDRLRQLLELKITGLICPHEDWGLQLHYLLHQLKVRIPEDLSVISGEVPGVNEWFLVPQTAIAQDMSGITGAVLNILGKLLDGEIPQDTYCQVMLPPRLIERQSVRVLS